MLHPESPDDPVHEDDDEDHAFLRFLRDEGLEALAAFRAIKDASTRAAFVLQMREAAKAEHGDEGSEPH